MKMDKMMWIVLLAIAPLSGQPGIGREEVHQPGEQRRFAVGIVSMEGLMKATVRSDSNWKFQLKGRPLTWL